MKYAISTIALKGADYPQILRTLKSVGIGGLEVAPGIVFGSSFKEDFVRITDWSQIVKDSGLQIVAVQSLFYGREDLQLFGDSQSRQAFYDHFIAMLDLCHRIGAGVAVFGSARSRRLLGKDLDEANKIAVEVFTRLAGEAQGRGVIIAIEPVASFYGCDFLATTQQAADFVRQINHPAIRLHMDTGTMVLNQEPIEKTIRSIAFLLVHAHINNPNLSPPASTVNHPLFACTLKEIGYKNWLSFEFRSEPKKIIKDLSFALECYRILE